MSRGRRAVLLLGLALVLGGLAASSVSRREGALAARLGPLVTRVVAARDLDAGRPVRAQDLIVRSVPARFAPADGVARAAAVAGQSPAIAIARGSYVTTSALRRPGELSGPPVGPGERAVDVVALGSPDLVLPGARVDVVVTREHADGAGATELALEDVEVLDAQSVDSDDASARDSGDPPRVDATLRVSVRQAVFLAAAQSFAREVRLLPRVAGDRERAGAVRYGESLR